MLVRVSISSLFIMFSTMTCPNWARADEADQPGAPSSQPAASQPTEPPQQSARPVPQPPPAPVVMVTPPAEEAIPSAAAVPTDSPSPPPLGDESPGIIKEERDRASNRDYSALRLKGSINLGGSALFTGTFASASGSSSNGATFQLRPSLGYSVIDGLEIGGLLSVGGQFGDLYSNGVTIGVLAGLRYVFDTGSRVMPFVGAYGGTEIIIADTQNTVTAGVLDVGGGILVALSNHVALSFGIEAVVVFITSPATVTVVRLPAGFFGVSAFL